MSFHTQAFALLNLLTLLNQSAVDVVDGSRHRHRYVPKCGCLMWASLSLLMAISVGFERRQDGPVYPQLRAFTPRTSAFPNSGHESAGP